MDRILHSTATPSHQFTEGDPGTGTPATTVTATWLNGVQEELVHLLELAGITPDAGNLTQVKAALDVLYSGAGDLTALTAALAAETSARAAADASLVSGLASVNARVTAEENARALADATLANNTAATVSNLQTQITTEVNARTAADNALDARTGALETYAALLSGKVSRVVAIPRTGAPSFRWYHLGTLVDSEDSVFAQGPVFSMARYADGLFSLSLQVALTRATLGGWNILAPMELRVSDTGPELDPLLTYLLAVGAIVVPVTVLFQTGDVRPMSMKLSANFPGGGPYIYAHFSQGPANGLYSYGDLKADCDIDRDGDTAAWVVLNVHTSFVLPQV